MAGSATIGSLRVDLGLNSANFSKGLKQSQSTLARVGEQMKRVGAVMAAGLGAAAAAMAVAVRGAIADMDKMAKASQRLGIGVEELSRLRHAADLSGVSFEALGTGMRRLSQSMADAAAGTGEASEAFARLGINVTNADGTLKSSTAVLQEMADRFARMQDGADKTAISIDILGRSGADLIPLLNAGSDGIQAMMDEADALGITLSTRTAKAAEAFGDNLTRLRRIFDGIVIKVTAHLLPSLERLSQNLVEVANNSKLTEGFAKGLGEVFKWAALIAVDLAGAIRQISAETRGLGQALKHIGAGEFSEALEAFRKGVAEGSAAFEQAEALKRAIRGEGGSHNPGTHPAERGGPVVPKIPKPEFEPFVLPPISAGGGGRGGRGGAGGGGLSEAQRQAEQAAEAFAGLSERIRDKIAATREEIALSGLEGAARERMAVQLDVARINTEALSEALRAKGRVGAEELAQLGQLLGDYTKLAEIRIMDAEAAERQRAAMEQTKERMERLSDTISGTLGDAFRGALDGAQSFKETMIGIMTRLRDTLIDAAFKPIGDALAGMFSNLGKGGATGGGGIFGKVLGGILGSFVGGFAAGGTIPSGGWGIAGEAGAELVSGPARVFSNADSRRMMSGGDGAPAIHLTVDEGVKVAWLNDAARQSVQITRKGMRETVQGIAERRAEDPHFLR